MITIGLKTVGDLITLICIAMNNNCRVKKVVETRDFEFDFYYNINYKKTYVSSKCVC